MRAFFSHKENEEIALFSVSLSDSLRPIVLFVAENEPIGKPVTLAEPSIL